MTLRLATALALLILAPSAWAEPAAQCRPVAGPCFQVRGRIALYNGTPTLRLWPIGTRRILGLVAPDGGDESRSVLPENVWALGLSGPPPGWSRPVRGDFTLCPLTPERPGRMRLVCVRSARRLSLGQP